MGKMKVIKGTSQIPMDVSSTSNVYVHSGCDTKDSFLNAKIDKEIERATTEEDYLQRQINELVQRGFSVRDVVNTHVDLESYDTSCLIDGDIIVVLYDNNDCSSYYKWTGLTFVSLGSSNYTVDKIDELITDITEQIDYLKLKASVKDVVSSHAELLNYDVGILVENDVIIVLVDETRGDHTTYYKLENGEFVLVGNVGPNYYNIEEIDEIVDDIYEVLDNHEERITENRDDIDYRATENEAYDILVNG